MAAPTPERATFSCTQPVVCYKQDADNRRLPNRGAKPLMKSMMRLSILAAMIVLAVRAGMAFSACAATTSPDDPLVHLRPGHPRLLINDEELKTALAAVKTDPLRAQLNRHIIAMAEFILIAPPNRQPDNDLGQEQGRNAVYDILTEAMPYGLLGNERFLFRAKKDLLTVSAFSVLRPTRRRRRWR
jgi:hypothetical protein